VHLVSITTFTAYTKTTASLIEMCRETELALKTLIYIKCQLNCRKLTKHHQNIIT